MSMARPQDNTPLRRVHDHDRIDERRQLCPHGWSQVGELLLSRAVQPAAPPCLLGRAIERRGGWNQCGVP